MNISGIYQHSINNIRIVIISLFFIALMLPAGCNKKSSPAENDIQIQLQNMSDCKDDFLSKGAEDVPNDQDCIEYVYTAGGRLQLRHINAGFNCCPVLEPEIEVSGNVITIREIEVAAECQCQCLFDLDFEITGVTTGVYVISVVEPYTNEGDEKLEFEVNLMENPVGTFCVSRDHYPWNMPQ